MIDGLKGAAVLKELTTIAQNLEKKLGLPVSLEVVQKLAQTPDGYKYLSQIDGKLLETLSKKELEVGMRYWADGTKNEAKNSLILENIVQKPHLLQNELFSSQAVLKALSLEKLVEILKTDLKESISPQSTQNTQTAQKQPQNIQIKGEEPQNTVAKKEEQLPQTVEPSLQKSALRLEAAKLNLSSSEALKESPKDRPLSAGQKEEREPQKGVETLDKKTVAPQSQNAEHKVASGAGAHIEGKKTAVLEELKTAEPSFKKDQILLKDSSPKESSAEVLKKEILSKIKEGVSLSLESRSAPLKIAEEPKKESLKKEDSGPVRSNHQREPKDVGVQSRESADAKGAALQKKELQGELREFKNIAASPYAPTKAELEKAKSDFIIAQKEQKIPSWESLPDLKKVEIAGVVSEILANSVQIADRSLISSAAEKILEAVFGDLPHLESDEAVLKALEGMLEKMKAKEEREGSKKLGEKLTQKGEENQNAVESDGAKLEERGEQKAENPASKLKAQLLDELAKVATKSEFQALSQVAIALNKEVFTFVLEDRGVVQFRKGGRDKELNAKRIEFYSAFETLGPVCGEIAYGGATAVLSIYAEFESTYKILKENIKELSYFDQKNVAIKHGIKEISEIKNSFLDTTG